MRPCIDTVIEEHGADPVPAEHERKTAPASAAPPAGEPGPEPKPAARAKTIKAKE